MLATILTSLSMLGPPRAAAPGASRLGPAIAMAAAIGANKAAAEAQKKAYYELAPWEVILPGLKP